MIILQRWFSLYNHRNLTDIIKLLWLNIRYIERGIDKKNFEVSEGFIAKNYNKTCCSGGNLSLNFLYRYLYLVDSNLKNRLNVHHYLVIFFLKLVCKLHQKFLKKYSLFYLFSESRYKVESWKFWINSGKRTISSGTTLPID